MSQIQIVNLYLPEFRQKKEWLDAARAAQLLGAALLVMAGVSAMQIVKNGQVAAELATYEQQRQEAVLETQKLSNEVGAKVEDRGLVGRIERLTTELESKQALLQFMNGRQMGNSKGFSEYLADLSRYHTNGLSLSLIRLDGGGETVHLEGEVFRAELVPIYLQNLSQGASYKGKSFQTLEITESSLSLLGSLSSLAGVETNRPEIWNFSVSSEGGQ